MGVVDQGVDDRVAVPRRLAVQPVAGAVDLHDGPRTFQLEFVDLLDEAETAAVDHPPRVVRDHALVAGIGEALSPAVPL